VTNDQIRTVLNEKPFRPFIMFMADGRTFEVSHPEWVLPHPFGRTVTYINPLDGSQSILDLFLMTEILTPEPLKLPQFPSPTKRPKNPEDPESFA
jgi:hypothetical protein